MATLNVPNSYATIRKAVAAAAPGDTIVVAAGYAGDRYAFVTVDDLKVYAPGSVTGIKLVGTFGAPTLTLLGKSPIDVSGSASDAHVVGNAGNNRISGGTGDDRIDGGAGNDTIDVQDAGRDVLNGGAGNDWIELDLDVPAGGKPGGRVDGGTGTDTVAAKDLGNYSFANVEVLELDASSRPNVVATAAQLSSFASIVNGEHHRDDIKIELRGTGGTLDFSNRLEAGAHVKVEARSVTSGLKMTGTATADELTGTHYDDTISGGGGNDLFDEIADRSGRTGNDRLLGGAGNDRFMLGDAGRGSVDGGTGRDIVSAHTLGSFTFRNVEVLDGDTEGTIAQVSSFRDFANSKFSRSSRIELVGEGGSIDFSHKNVEVKTLHITGFHLSSGVRITGSAKADDISGTRFNDTLDGGAGNDRIDVGIGGAKETVKGGSGNDQIDLFDAKAGSIDGGSGIDTVSGFELGRMTFRNVEVLKADQVSATLSQLSSFDKLLSYSSKFGDHQIDLALKGTGGTIRFSQIVKGSDGVALDATALKSGINATGTSKADILHGSRFADTLDGAAGSDTIYGDSDGIDFLTGGSGADTFVFNTASLAGGTHHIVDFAPSSTSTHDLIKLSGETFGSLASGPLAEAAFKDLGVAGAVVDATDRVLYDHTTGVLSYDADGSGAKAAVQFAVLDNHAHLTAHDFSV